MLDCSKIKLIFKLAYTATDVAETRARAVAAPRPEHLFSLVDMTLNGVRINDH